MKGNAGVVGSKWVCSRSVTSVSQPKNLKLSIGERGVQEADTGIFDLRATHRARHKQRTAVVAVLLDVHSDGGSRGAGARQAENDARAICTNRVQSAVSCTTEQSEVCLMMQGATDAEGSQSETRMGAQQQSDAQTAVRTVGQKMKWELTVQG
eukprot:1157430-Pelagomonas_calceolata.AAC.2